MRRTTIASPQTGARRSHPPRTAEKICFALACLFAAAALLGAVCLASWDSSQRWDFEAFYVAGTILRTAGPGHLYDVALQQRMSSALYPGHLFLAYFHTPLEALLFWPLAALPFRTALLVWSAVTLAAFAASLLGLRSTGRRLQSPFHFVFSAFALLFLVALLGIGQDTTFLLLAGVRGLLLLQRGREGAAGAVLGLGLYRFEVMLPLLAIFALRRRWRLLSGAAAVAAVGLLGSWALVGTAGLRAYLQVLLASGQVKGGWGGVVMEGMPNLRGLLVVLLGGVLPPRLLLAVIVLASAALLLWAARCCTALDAPGDFRLPLHYSIAIIAALLASYHLFQATLVPLLLVAFVALTEPSSPPAERWLAVGLMLPWRQFVHRHLTGLPTGPTIALQLLVLLPLLVRRASRLPHTP